MKILKHKLSGLEDPTRPFDGYTHVEYPEEQPVSGLTTLIILFTPLLLLVTLALAVRILQVLIGG